MTSLITPPRSSDCTSDSRRVRRREFSGGRDLQRLNRLLDALPDIPLAPAITPPHTALPYVRTLLRKDHVEIASAHWFAGRSCVLHGHSGSAVLFRVLSGTLVEERYLPDGNGGYRYEVQTLQGGQQSFLPPGSIHRIHCLEDTATVHAFNTPPTNAVEPVPASVMELLAAARRRVLASIA